MTDLTAAVERLDLEALRRVAEAATQGNWRAGEYADGHGVGCGFRIALMTGGEVGRNRANAAHIATFDPPTVLALLTALSTGSRSSGVGADVARSLSAALHNAATELHHYGSARAEDYARQAADAIPSAVEGERLEKARKLAAELAVFKDRPVGSLRIDMDDVKTILAVFEAHFSALQRQEEATSLDRMIDPAPEVWVRFADNGGIRMWKATPFDGAHRYALHLTSGASDVR